MPKIRQLNKADLPSCAKLYVLAFNAEPWNDKWTAKAALQRLIDVYKTPRFYGIVCTENSKIIGALLGNVEWWYEKRHFNLKEMYIDPLHQRRGLGSAMIKRLRSDIMKQEVIGIYLSTSTMSWTSKFYLKNGFKTMKNMQMMNAKLE